MTTYLHILVLSLLFTFHADAAEKMPDGSRIPTKADTIVLASSKPAKDFYKELKKRAVMNNYSFSSTDSDAYVFVTEYFDVTKRASVQFKVYVKDVSGGSNAIYSGRYMDIKKLKTRPWWRSEPIHYRKKGKAAGHAWDAFHKFAVGAKKWKYTYLKR